MKGVWRDESDLKSAWSAEVTEESAIYGKGLGKQEQDPSWAVHVSPCVMLGRHEFFQLRKEKDEEVQRPH